MNMNGTPYRKVYLNGKSGGYRIQFQEGMPAPFLKINDQPVMVGTKYWTVTKKTLRKLEHVANGENDSVIYEYFLSEAEADKYVDRNTRKYSMVDVERIVELIKGHTIGETMDIVDTQIARKIKNEA